MSRKGSLEYWPHRRAKRQLPRVRSWKKLAEPIFSGLVAYKAGMTHMGLIDDSNSPAKGTEVASAATVLEFPKIYLYGIRFYTMKDYKGPASDIYNKDLAEKVGIKKTENTAEKLGKIKENIDSYTDVTALMFSDASNLGFGNKRVMRFETRVGGKSPKEKLSFLEGLLGKEVRAKDIFKEGEYLDVTSISKGKGWVGIIKRFKVARQMRKATGKIRHLGTLGAWHPPKVLFTVPHSGHMGYNYRTEPNKRILKVGDAASANTINVKGGFLNYGIIKNDFIVIKGSIPGPARRLVRIKKAIRSRREEKQPQITYISVESKQGA